MLLELEQLIASPAFAVATCVVLAAGFMRGFIGVGSGMLMAPVFAIIFGPLSTVGTIVLLELAITMQLLPSLYRMISWNLILPMSAAAAVFMPLGNSLLVNLEAELMTRGMALVVLVLVLILMTGWRYRGPKRMPITLGVGMISGVLMAATSLGNPPVMLYLLSGTDSAATNRANFTGYFLLTLVLLLSLMLARQLISTSTIMQAGTLLPMYVFSAWMGTRCFRKANEELYRRVALGLLVCVALYGLLR